MNLKRVLLVFMAVGASAVILASGASATVTAEGEWYLGTSAPGTTLTEGSSKAVSCGVGGPGFKLALTGTVGTTPVKLESSEVECISARLFNKSGHGEGRAILKFSGVTVKEPTGCTVENETVETIELKSELYMATGSANPFVKFEPVTVGGNFAVVDIKGTCAAAGSRIVKGNVFGMASNPTSTPAVTQPLEFSSAIDTTAGSELKFSGNPAHLEGTINNSLSSAEKFMAH